MTEVVYTAEFQGSTARSFSAVYPALCGDYFYQQDVYSAEFRLSTSSVQGGVLAFVLKNPKGDEKYKLEIKSAYHQEPVIVNQPVYFDNDWPSGYVVKCTVTYYSTMLIDTRPNSLMGSHISRLSENPENLMTFQCDAEAVKALISLMSVASPVIDAMMKSDCIEAKSKSVKVVDITADVIRKAVEFCETNQIAETEDVELDLCKVAEKYDFDRLQKYAAALVVKTMTKENVIELFQFAKMYNNGYLEEYCVQRGVTDLTEIVGDTDYASLSSDSVKDFFAAVKQKM